VLRGELIYFSNTQRKSCFNMSIDDLVLGLESPSRPESVFLQLQLPPGSPSGVAVVMNQSLLNLRIIDELTTTEMSDITTTEMSYITTTEFPEIMTTEMPEIMTTGMPEITTTGIPEITTTEKPTIIPSKYSNLIKTS